MRADGSAKLARETPPTRPFPYLSGLSAQRVSELVAFRVAPAVTASAIAYSHLNSHWQGMLVLVSMLAVGAALRYPHYPLHLVPFSSAMLYLLTPPLGAIVAVGVSAFDSYAVRDISGSEMVAPVLGAWVVTGLGAVLNHRFRREREVRLAVIGSHEFARGLEAELVAVGVRGYRLVGCIDPEHACREEMVAGVRCLGSLGSLRETIVENGIELLVLGPLAASSSEPAEGRFQAAGVSRLDVFERVADACLDLPVSMIEAGQLYEELFGHVPLGTTTSAWFQYLLHPRYRGSSPTSKRALDLAVGSVAGLIAIPLVLFAAIAIKLTDRGPIFHRQLRIGERGRELHVVKLRTMTLDAEGPLWTDEEDARITLVGRILRRLHIDELPQIWLVLRGDMSLVGPRPEQPSLVTQLEARFSYYDRRHLVKPGITGWAQVRCGYSGSDIGSAWKLCHDLYYLKRQSTLFDLLILVETLSTVVVPEPINRPDERFIVRAPAEELSGRLEQSGLEVT